MRTRESVLSLLRDNLISRVVTAVVVLAFGLLVTEPLAAALNDPPEPAGPVQAARLVPGQALADTLRETRGLLRAADAGLRRGEAIAQERQALAAARARMTALDAEVMAEFAAVEDLLRARHVPPAILERHQATVSLYRDEMEAVLEDLSAVEAADTVQEMAVPIERSERRLSERRLERSQQPFDPAELPHEAQQPRPGNLPKLERDEFVGAGLFDTPLVHLAALEAYRLDQLPGASDPDYLAETVEVQLTPAVRAKAEELDHDPVAIYHWVRNHVEWLPTWGAVQDADLTLSARRGNAMDIASLLAALLRASGIPARYVHGTIDVPEERFRNWAGGFEQIEAAMNYAASGGIPVTALIQGGRIAQVRLEHVWVEAAVDFLPSRGAVMVEADTWLPLDASFKQHEFLSGLDVPLITGLDGDALLQDLLATGTVNEAEGWIQGLDPAGLVAAQEAAEDSLAAFVEQLEDPTVGDIIGGRKVILRESPVLPSGLPYQRAVAGVRYAALPESLQPRIAFGLGADVLGQPIHQASFPWASLNNRKATLSFRPATEDDQAVLEALLPEGDISDLSQLPTSIPAYLIHVVPELKVEGETRLSGAPMPLGEELAFSYSVTDPVHGTRHYPNKVTAGSYQALGVIGGGVAATGVADAAERLRATAETLLSEDPDLIGDLTREDLLGELFHAGLLSYFGQYQAMGQLLAQSRGFHFQLTTAAGTFGYVPTVTYLFGIPSSIMHGGVVMDLDRVAMISSTDGEGREMRAALNFQLGALASALEHAVPEQLFLPEGSEGEGVSAVRALQKAIAAGQRVYHITPANQADVLPHIRQNSLTMSEIRASLAVGREVIVHADPITVPGWRGAGYIIFDPQTGAGAWKIGGGANGGLLFAADLSATIFGTLFSYKSMLAHIWGAKAIADILSRVSNSFVVIGFIIGLIDIAEKCRTAAATFIVAAYTAIALIFLAASGFLGFATGPVGLFLAGTIFGGALGYFRGMLVDIPFCD
jgi:transglutaminase-like putative cysteine protease